MASLALAFDILARDNASKTFDKVGASAERAGQKGGLFGKSMGGVFAAAGKAALAGGAAVGAGLTLSISKAMDFDKTMRTVGATLSTSGPVQKQLSDLAMKLGKETVFSAADASDAMLELAKNGMSAAQIQAGALSATMTLAAAGGLEMGAAATYMGNALNTFGLQAKDANAVAAALAGGANASSASVESLGMALSQVGPGAKTAGLSIQTTTAILAAFDNAGIKGSDAGTSLKTMLTRLVPQTDKAAGAMEELGLKFTDAKGNFVPMTNVAQQLQDKLKGLSDEQRTTALATIFGSDATRAATVLMNLGAAGVEKYTKATSDQGAAQRMANTSMEGAAGAWEGFKGSLETIAITVGVKLLPLFTKLVNWGNDIAGTLLNNVEPAFNAISTAVQDFIRDFQSGQGAAGTFRSALESAGAVIQSVSKWVSENQTLVKSLGAAILGGVVAFQAISTAVRAYTAVQAALNLVLAANPIGLVIVAVAALAAGLIYAYQNSETFRSYVTTAFSMVKIGALSLAGVAVGAFQKLVNFWFIVVGGILEGANKAFSWVPGIGPKLSQASKAFVEFRDRANASLNGIQDDIQVKIRTEQAAIALEELHREFINKGWTVTAQARVNMVYTGGGQVAPARAKGGPVRAGGIYAVGDNPDGSWNATTELFVPNTSGRIYNQSQLAASGGSPLVADGGGRMHPKDLEALQGALREGARQGTAAGFGRNVQEAYWGSRVG